MSFSEWKEVKLNEVINFKNGRKKPDDEGSIPIYGGNGVLGYTNTFNNEKVVIIGRVGAYCGSVYYEPGKCWISDNAFSAQAIDDNSIKYVYYMLKSLKLNERRIGTGQPLLTQSILNNINTIYPEGEEQNAIADTLSCLDEKIELNNRMNKTLEEMSQAIFKSWFVDFEPFQDGEFEDSEIGRIPKGWKIKSIGEITKIIRGASPRPIQDFLSTEGMPWLKISDATSSNSKYITKTNEFIKIEGVAKSRRVLPGTLILSNSATPGIPRVMLIEACVHDGWLIFDDYTELPKEYIYYLLLNERDKILSLSNGSVFRNLKTDILKTYKIVVPPKDVVDKIIPTFIGINKIIKYKVKEIENITNIRDTLLPKLMSGEIRVPIEEV